MNTSARLTISYTQLAQNRGREESGQQRKQYRAPVWLLFDRILSVSVWSNLMSNTPVIISTTECPYILSHSLSPQTSKTTYDVHDSAWKLMIPSLSLVLRALKALPDIYGSTTRT